MTWSSSYNPPDPHAHDTVSRDLHQCQCPLTHLVLRRRIDLLTIPFLHRVRAVEALECLRPRPLCHNKQVAVLDAGRKAAERTTEVESAALLATLDRWLCNLCHTRDTQPVVILTPQCIVWQLSLHLEAFKAHGAPLLSVPTRLLPISSLSHYQEGERQN